MPLSDEELERYARHIVLREIGGPGQAKLRRARVAVVGAGGLGSPALMYLAAAGVGRLTVIDNDLVSLSNLQRQVIHGTGDVGRHKTDSARDAIARINPGVQVLLRPARLDASNVEALLGDADLVLDGSDSFETRRLVNAACVQLGKVLISAAIGQWEGQLSTFRPWEGGPCWECVFPNDPAPGLVPSCAEGGVLGALAGVMGTMQAAEAVKEITGAGEGLTGRLLLWDGLSAESRVIKVKARADCPVCGGLHRSKAV